MTKKRFPGPLAVLPYLTKWILLACLIGIVAGGATAVFLVALWFVTRLREAHTWLIALLPVAGLMVGLVYMRHGRDIEPGNNLLIDEVHDPRKVTPARMAPLILLATLVTHLFGGSAGREGTAVQMGGSLADQLTRLFRMDNQNRRLVLMAGISAGFSSVFGTPLAGAVFGLEVLSIGRLRYDAIFPCFIAAIVGDRVTAQITAHFGVAHAASSVPFVPPLLARHLLSAVVAGAAFGIVGSLFARVTHGITEWFRERISYPPLRPAIGGLIIAVVVFSVGGLRYVGLGDPTIADAFTGPVRPWDFVMKLLFTSLTLGSGFKGGEVTPLFFIGATLGNALSPLLTLPLPVVVAMGFVGVFAGAANTPIACTLMAIEIFGAPIGVLAGVACVTSYLFSGHSGIYASQRVDVFKPSAEEPTEP